MKPIVHTAQANAPRTRRALLRALWVAPILQLIPAMEASAQSGKASGARANSSGFEEIPWDDLMPPDWNPLKDLGITDLSGISDGDPRAEAIMSKLRDVLDAAPTRPELDGRRVRLPGYVVPLDGMLGGSMKEFLLVPYFGACIHSPPPPANQIVLVRSNRSRELQTMDAVWVNGSLRVARSDSRMGASGYALDAVVVEPYTAPSPRR